MPSRTLVVSENITVAPARTSKSVQKPTVGLAVAPENASLPPHCTSTTSSLAGTVWRRQALQMSYGLPDDAVHHGLEAQVRVILQTHHVQRIG